MSYFEAHSSIRKTLPAIIAGLALFIAGAISVSGLNIFGFRIGFGFVPLLILIIWPRQANTMISLCLVFVAGFFTDWAIGGIVGQSTLIYVLIWGFFRPEFRSSPFSPIGLLSIWLTTCGLTLVVLCLSGYFVLGILPDFFVIGCQMILATFLLPVLMLLRQGLVIRFSDREDWG